MISAIILAAGTSSRLGRPKQLLELHGKPLLQHVIDTADRTQVDEIVVVLGHRSESIATVLALPERARTVLNTDYRKGLSSSLLTGLGALGERSEAAVILLGDQPGIPSAAIDEVVGTFRAQDAPLVRAVWHGVPGHPVVIARSEWPRLHSITGDRGARDLLAPAAFEVEIGVLAPHDVDTWGHYELALREMSR